jgi:hypothetical protein
MNKIKSEQASEPLRLRENVIIDGRFYSAGSPVPFASEVELPESLKHLIATGDEPPFYTHSERLIYDGRSDLGEPATLYKFLDGQGIGVRRQAMQVSAGLQEQVFAEQAVEASNKLPPETEEALAAAHSRHIGLERAQLQYDRDAIDRAYESATQEAESRTVVFHVKRGAVYVRYEKTKLKPGETVYTKQPNGEMWAAGIIDAEGQPPDSEIHP